MEDKVTAIKILDTHEDPPDKGFMSGLIKLIYIFFFVLPGMIKPNYETKYVQNYIFIVEHSDFKSKISGFLHFG